MVERTAEAAKFPYALELRRLFFKIIEINLTSA